MLDFKQDTAPSGVPDLFDRLVRLVRTIPDVLVFPGVEVGTSAEGTFVRHGLNQQPRAVVTQVVGTSASSAVVAVEKTATFIKLRSAVACTVDLVVYV